MKLLWALFNDVLATLLVFFTIGMWGAGVYLLTSFFLPTSWTDAFILGGIMATLYQPLRTSMKKELGD